MHNIHVHPNADEQPA